MTKEKIGVIDENSQEIQDLKIRLDLPNASQTSRNFAIECGQVMSDKYTLFRKDDSDGIFRIITKTSDVNGKKYLDLKISNKIDIHHELEKYIQGIQYNSKGEPKKSKIPFSLTKEIADSNDFIEQLPSINATLNTQMPVIKNGKLILLDRGYNEEFKIWVNTNSYQVTKNDMTLEEAKNILEKLFGDFCFETEQDKHNAIASFLTPFIRGLQEDKQPYSYLPPVWLYEANRERAGKDYLAGMTSILYTGGKPVFDPIAGMPEEELQKKITSIMKNGGTILHSGNNKKMLNSSTLESLSTSLKYIGRILGKSEVITMKNNLMISLSANRGFKYTADMDNRMIRIKLFYPEENANERTFKNPNLSDWLFNNGDQILSALFTLVKNWFNKGKPKSSKNFASYHEWAEICGGIMESAGYLNPCSLRENDDIGGDEEGREMKFLFEECYKDFKNTDKNINDIREFVNNSPETFEFKSFTEPSDVKYFTKLILKYEDREKSGITLLCVRKDRHIQRRRFVFVKKEEVEKIKKQYEDIYGESILKEP